MPKYEFVAVDFDGTLCADTFPEVGAPNRAVIAYVKKLAADGSKIILYTSRENGTRKLLDEAMAFCNQGMDARLVTDRIAGILARLKWIRFIRFSCDQIPQIEAIERAAELLETVFKTATMFSSFSVRRFKLSSSFGVTI